MANKRRHREPGPRRGVFTYDIDGPRPGKVTPILWPPRLPSWWGESERREAARYVSSPNSPFFFCKREEFRVELFAEQNGACHWCRNQMSMERKRITVTGRIKDNQSFASFEHIKPRSMGGVFSRHNIKLAHASCNRERPQRRFEHDPYADILKAQIRKLGKAKKEVGHEKVEEDKDRRYEGRLGVTEPRLCQPSESNRSTRRGGAPAGIG